MAKWYKEQKGKYKDWHKYIGIWIKDQWSHRQLQDWILFAISIIFISLYFICKYTSFQLYYGSYNERVEQLYLFSAISQSLAAIFALTFSLILVALQHIGSNYTPRAFKLHTFSIYYFLFFAIFLSTIGFSIYLNGKFQKYPNSLSSLKIDILEMLFFFALAFMIPFSIRSVRLMRPGDIMLRLGWKITERRFNYYTIYKHKVNHFLQSIFDMNKACIRRSDILTIEVGLNLFSKRIRLLARRCNNETSSADIAMSICNHYSDVAYYANENKSCNGCKIIIYSLNNIIDGYKASKYRSPIKVFFYFLKRVEIDIKRFNNKIYREYYWELNMAINELRKNISDIMNKEELLLKNIYNYQHILDNTDWNNLPMDYARLCLNLGENYLDLSYGNIRENIEKAIKFLMIAFKKYEELGSIKQKIKAINSLGTANALLAETLSGKEWKKAYEKAKKYFENILMIYTKTNLDDYAEANKNLGYITHNLSHSMEGDEIRNNLSNAKNYYKESLKIYKKNEFPSKYASTQNNLGSLYYEISFVKEGAERKSAIEKSINCFENALKIQTKLEFPSDYAVAQSNKGSTYLNLASGLKGKERKQKLIQAKICFNNALKTYTKKDSPTHYANVNNNLGATYRELSEGAEKEEKLKNIGKAIKCYRKALEIRTKNNYPFSYARILNNLGTAYRSLAQELEDFKKSKTFLSKAIKSHKKVIKILTRNDYPAHFAGTQDHLGTAYLNLAEIINTKKCKILLHIAIECFNKALEIKTRNNFSYDYSSIKKNLGCTYNQLGIIHEKEEKIKIFNNSIECFNEALQTRTLKDFPMDYAETQNHLAFAYFQLSSEIDNINDKIEYLKKSINCCNNALKIYTKQDFPKYFNIAINNKNTVLKRLRELETM